MDEEARIQNQAEFGRVSVCLTATRSALRGRISSQCGSLMLICGHMIFQNKKNVDLKANVEIEP